MFGYSSQLARPPVRKKKMKRQRKKQEISASKKREERHNPGAFVFPLLLSIGHVLF